MVELRSSKRREKKKKVELEPEKIVTPRNEPSNNSTKLVHIRCNAVLWDAIQEYINSCDAAGDFTYTSASDIIRESLRHYRDGMQLTEMVMPGEKVASSVNLDEDLFEYYRSLPNRKKSQIMERAIRTFMKHELG